MLDGQTLHYLWLIDDAEWPTAESRVNVLLQEARYLLALGWGIDMAVGQGRLLTPDEADALTGERWHPWPNHGLGEDARRVAVIGTLENLMRVHTTCLNRFDGKLYRPPDKLSVFGTVHYLTGTAIPRRSSTAFVLEPFRRELHRPALRQETVAKVSAMLRHTACEAAKADSPHVFPGGSERYVAGHIPNRNDQSVRFSYLPLPTIGHPHADGLIRRVLIAEPYGGDGVQIAWASRRLLNRELVEDTTQKTYAFLAKPEAEDSVINTYTKASKTWASVTPVVLPGFDEGKYEKALGLLRKAVQQAGLAVEMIEDVNLRKAPFWPGSQHPRLYFRPDYLRGLPAWHVHLQFYEPVPGPLTIGAGRHCGLGLFVPA